MDENECNDCGYEFSSCEHIKDRCMCSTTDMILRANCIACIFSGKWDNEEWDSLSEVLDSIAYGAYKIGVAHGKRQFLLPLASNSDCHIKSLYKLYKAGYNYQTKDGINNLCKN